MKLRVYLSDWFFNMGMVGFKRILEHAETYGSLNLFDYGFKAVDNYIEFEADLLREFHNYYFDYFLDRYDMAKLQGSQLDRYYNRCKNKDNYTENFEDIKDTIKRNNDKIKKIDEEIFKRADEIYKRLDSIKKEENLEELGELVESYKSILKEKIINQKITSNKFKSQLSKSFYGQVSYLNVLNSSKSIEEQKEIIFKDYIRPILEILTLKQYIEKDDYQGLKEHIVNSLNDKSLPSNIEKLYKGIVRKYLKKEAGIEAISQYLYSDEFSVCHMCGENHSFGSEYGEGDFIPLAVSTNNSRNMFWEYNTRVPICDICKLILFCAAAGSIDIYKGYMNENLDSEEKQYYAFVNMDTSFQELYKTNENFKMKKDKEAPFKELIFDLVSTEKKKSVWQLQNILYVEFNSDYKSKNCKLNYFNIPKHIAMFLKDKADVLNSIKEERFKAELVDNILNNVDIKFAIDKKLRKILSDDYGSAVDCYKAVKVRFYLNVFKGGNKEVISKVDDKKIKFIYMKGLELNKYYEDINAENKIESIAYRLLNAAKANNKKDFMDTLLRIHLNAGKEVPSIFLDIMTEKELAFEEIAHAFVSGLISKAYNKEELKPDDNQ